MVEELEMACATAIAPQGDALEERHYRALEARWITREQADGAFLRYADTTLGAEIVGKQGAGGDFSGILIL
jgi:hypothetical protein